MSTIAEIPSMVTIGVDTHADTHTAVVLDARGGRLGQGQFRADGAGYAALEDWALSFGVIDKVGVEGTGSWGAGLTAHLQDQGYVVIEVDQPDRKMRRQLGKSDPIDAEAAARSVQAGTATTVPKDRTGDVECIRVLHAARNSAVKARAEAQTQLKSLVSTAPETLRAQLRGLSTVKLIRVCAGFRPRSYTTPIDATRTALRSIARRMGELSDEIKILESQLRPLVTKNTPPKLLESCGIGIISAAQLLVTFGANPERITTAAKFTRLVGTSPIPASSGKTSGEHRLNRGGDRQANAAIHRIAMKRRQLDPRSQQYMNRRINDGLSKARATRCLKNYIALEIYRELTKFQVDRI